MIHSNITPALDPAKFNAPNVTAKGERRASVVLACTLLWDDPQFEMGRTLEQSRGAVKLNHPHCAKFCVLGGASCSA